MAFVVPNPERPVMQLPWAVPLTPQMEQIPNPPDVDRIVHSGEIVKRKGLYRYFKHPDGDQINCEPSIKEKQGRLLVDGLPAPNLGCCPHKISWYLMREI